MNFEICTDEELNIIKKEYKLELMWLPRMNYKITYEGKIVALFSGSLNENILEIENFEVLEKGNGYGRSVIEQLKTEVQHITIIPWPGSEKFWKKCGFNFIEAESVVVSMEYKKIN